MNGPARRRAEAGPFAQARHLLRCGLRRVRDPTIGTTGAAAVIKYIGSKRALVPWILSTVAEVGRVAPVRRVGDLFSGSARVAHAFKAAGFEVVANDLMTYGHVLATALVAADARHYSEDALRGLLADLNRLTGRDGWFSALYAEEARFFHPKNARRIQAVRDAIPDVCGSDDQLRAILLTSLMLAADRVDSTTGVQMAYLKRWAPRALGDLNLSVPPLLAGPGWSLQGEAQAAAEAVEVDLVYLDPPYNQHSYLGNYHLWETLVLWDCPPTYGVARKRLDCRTRKSAFNHKGSAPQALRSLVAALRADHVVVSFSNEGYLTAADIEDCLGDGRFVVRLQREHPRYIGSRIGIYSPGGVKVGSVSHTRNVEYLFVATRRRPVYDALSHAAPAAGYHPRPVPGV